MRAKKLKTWLKKSLKEGWDHGTMGPLFTSALGEVRGGRQRTDGAGAHAGHPLSLFLTPAVYASLATRICLLSAHPHLT